VWFIGLVGAAYAVFGGLKAVAVSDSLNGIGLLIAGMLVPVFGVLALGGGSFSNGLGELVNPSIDDRSLIRVGKRFTTAIALLTMFGAPFVAYAPEGLFQFVRRSTGFFSIPMITLVLMGFFTTRTSGVAARIAVIFYILCYTTIVFILGEPINFIHTMGLLFLAMVGIILAVSYVKPRPEPFQLNLHKRAVDVTPWKYGPAFAAFLFSLLIFVYVVCSPMGVASQESVGLPFYITIGALTTVAATFMVGLTLQRIRNP
jgi:SSS family solute:Na+ symporter